MMRVHDRGAEAAHRAKERQKCLGVMRAERAAERLD